MTGIYAALRKAEAERAETLAKQRKNDGDATELDPLAGLSSPLISSPPRPMLPHFSEVNWDLNSKYLFVPESQRRNVQIAAEEFRGLASWLQVRRSTTPLTTLLISSVLPAEGKTTTALNLAYAFAQNGSRVLLVDGDLRRSRLHLVLGTENSPGLADYLRDRNDVAPIVQKGSISNLYFVAAGLPASHPAELITGNRFEQFVEWAKRYFDWVVMDAPPAGVVSDATIMTRSFDGVLLVVRDGVTPLDMAERVKLSFPLDRVLGVILNRGETGRTYDSYYYPQCRIAR
jgi:capsular exopolysaccharide synthesis family protein